MVNGETEWRLESQRVIRECGKKRVTDSVSSVVRAMGGRLAWMNRWMETVESEMEEFT